MELKLTSHHSYFDLEWEGPVLDASGRPTREVKGKHPNHHPVAFPITVRHQNCICSILSSF